MADHAEASLPQQAFPLQFEANSNWVAEEAKFFELCRQGFEGTSALIRRRKKKFLSM